MFKKLDLRGTPCPVNFIRCRLALELLAKNQILNVDLDKGEPYEMVYNSVQKLGHKIKIILEDDRWIRLLVICCVK